MIKIFIKSRGNKGIGVDMIELDKITKIYNKEIQDSKALDEASITIKNGEFVAIMGPSGSGKSTLLNIIGCMDTATTGRYILDGEDITQLKRKDIDKVRKEKIGFVFQNFALMDYYTAYENIELPLLVKNVKRSERKRIIEEKMNYLGITDVKDKIPAKMSGGQQQRVAIARALVTDCDILLADEPTGALDQNTGKEVMKYLREINNDGKTVIVVTHDSQVADMTDRTIVICDGKVVEDRKKRFH